MNTYLELANNLIRNIAWEEMSNGKIPPPLYHYMWMYLRPATKQNLEEMFDITVEGCKVTIGNTSMYYDTDAPGTKTVDEFLNHLTSEIRKKIKFEQSFIDKHEIKYAEDILYKSGLPYKEET